MVTTCSCWLMHSSLNKNINMTDDEVLIAVHALTQIEAQKSYTSRDLLCGVKHYFQLTNGGVQYLRFSGYRSITLSCRKCLSKRDSMIAEGREHELVP